MALKSNRMIIFPPAGGDPVEMDTANAERLVARGYTTEAAKPVRSKTVKFKKSPTKSSDDAGEDLNADT